MRWPRRRAAVLFDLDGTLLDTAPDMARALNRVLAEEGRPPLPFPCIRPVVSHGGMALVRLGFGIGPEDPAFERLRRRFLDHYAAGLSLETRLFPGMERVLAALEAEGIPWGVVTNKPAWLTEPLLGDLGLAGRAAVVVSGDTLAVRKPDPAPILHALARVGADPAAALYVGDAERDVAAGRAAGTTTLVALFGYLGASDRPETWGADALVDAPEAILPWCGIAPARRAAPAG
ncbi:phosphoglycolate phosphatase [Inmirania thermothiophila]|uniref:Phosphoglycolate phosphatase n=1 Tax=Inmirania thermothiophila TaxID=1750597 RepID=A0A3N1Y0B0_9GAMM|nr:phosphoglycolate phosphatase [Inmirania thermothiophila]ROR32285.1 phosphoglycolate phosphatase [Inmirania thermothiophila]